MRKLNTVIAAVVALLIAGTISASGSPVVNTQEGPVQGLSLDGVFSFKGIPYATPPLGELRWRAPQPPAKRAETLTAKDFGNICVQTGRRIFGYRVNGSSEDCLTLNIWTPRLNSDESLPVMVWIHGGGYVAGSSSVPRLDGTMLAKQDVVVVSMNYRLNAFGFLTHPAITATQKNEIHANYGLLDVIAALNWVQDNIDQFGGDKNNVTIFGESAGANIVNNLLLTPQSDRLFHKAISQSSSLGLAPEPMLSKRQGFQPSGESAGITLAKAAGLDTSGMSDGEAAAALRKLSPNQILDATPANVRFTPVIDNQVRFTQSTETIANKGFHRVPLLIGGVSWEASLGREIGGGFSPENFAKLVPEADKDVLYSGLTKTEREDAIFGDMVILSPSRYIADQVSDAGVPVWHYHMTYIAEERRESQPGVAHADDIAFVMRTLSADLKKPTGKDRAVSNVMSSYWVQFAKTGNPNLQGQPEWPAYDSDEANVMLFGDSPKVESGFMQSRMNFHIERGKAFLKRITNKQ